MSLKPQVESNNDLTAGLDQALSDLASAISMIKTVGLTDADTSTFLFKYLVIPFDDAGHQIADIFQPNEEDLQADEQEFLPQVKEAVSNVTESFNNPIAPLINKQAALFTSMRQRAEDMFYASTQNMDPSQAALLGQIFDQAKMAMRSAFVSSQSNEANMAGMFMYATEEIQPMIDLEISHLTKMKALIYHIIEMASRLPSSFIPEIPSIVAIQKLCDAEEKLNQVLYELNNNQTLNKPSLASAATNVCSAKNVVKTGGVPAEYVPLMTKVFGFSAYETQALYNTQFTPDPAFKTALMKIETYNEYVQELDTEILATHNNLTSFSTALTDVSQIGISNVLTQIITVLKMQVMLIRTSLEGQALSFIKQTAGNAPDRLVVNGVVVSSLNDQLSVDYQRKLKRNVTGVFDIAGQTISLASAYAQLLALCHVMEQTKMLVVNIETMLTGQSPIMRVIHTATGNYSTDCGESNGASLISVAVTRFLDAAQARLAGLKEQNEVLLDAAADLLTRIKNHLKFLRCIKGRMSSSNQQVKKTAQIQLGGVSSAFKVKASVMNLARKYPAMKMALRQLDVRRLLGTEKVEYNGLDQLQKALQGIIVNCPDQNIQDIIRQLGQRFNDEFAKRKSTAITMGSFDEVPAVALRVAIKQRVTSYKEMLDMLQTVHDKFNLTDVCKRAAKGIPNQNASKTSTDELAQRPGATQQQKARNALSKQQNKMAQQTQRQKALAEEAARKLAAAKTTPFASG